ncbi:MAG: hypothetical protein ACRD0L_15225 [Acidimicrobiales bacterium]
MRMTAPVVAETTWRAPLALATRSALGENAAGGGRPVATLAGGPNGRSRATTIAAATAMAAAVPTAAGTRCRGRWAGRRE